MGAVTIVPEPRRLNPLLRLGVWAAERTTGRRMLPARLLAWYPRAAIGAGVLEALVAHREPSPRVLKLVRVTASLATQCPFCVDMNSFEADAAGVSPAELAALQRWTGGLDPAPPASFTPAERAAVEYARAISASPLAITDETKAAVARHFTEREVVVLATTAAQVNFWARTIQALGIPPAGFCAVPPATSE